MDVAWVTASQIQNKDKSEKCKTQRSFCKPLTTSTEFESRSRFDGVEQLCFQDGLVFEFRQLQQVHTGAGRWKAVGFGAGVLDAERGIEVLEICSLIR